MNPLLRAVLIGFGAGAVLSRLFSKGDDDMARVFISFDFDNDRRYAYLLKAFAANPAFGSISFRDGTPTEINSNDVGRIKAALSRKIGDATTVVIVVGKHANARHRDSADIGEINWQHWEIKNAIRLRKKLVAVKIDRSYVAPAPLMAAGASWALSFTETSIAQALRNA